jgi:NitT/TauT family transport system substrate-binding protein
MTMRSLVCRVSAAAFLLATAGAAPALAQGKAQGEKPWRHGIIEAKSDAGIFFMPSKGGFADKLLLNLATVQLKTDSIGLKALLAGELESFEGGAQGAIMAAARGADVRIIGCHWVVVPHGVFVRANINSLQDLKGKAIAVSAPGTFPELVARAALEKAGIADSEVKFAAMGGDADRYKALAAGVVDAAVISNEYLPIAAREGIKELVPGREAVPNFVRVCLFTSTKVLNERRDDAIKFLAAESSGLRYALAHRDEAIKLTVEMTGAKPDDPRPAFVFDEAVRVSAVAPDLPIPLDKLDAMQQQLVSIGSLPKAIDLAKIVDGSIRAKALELATQ